MSPDSAVLRDGAAKTKETAGEDDSLPEGLRKDDRGTKAREHIATAVVKEERKSGGDGAVSPILSEDEEPQMSTPEDPVIHSPPSLRPPVLGGSPSTLAAALSQTSPLGYGQSPVGCENGRPSCDSPGSATDGGGDMDGRRRQKTCRVCGDHATGYNFNVITCESCKAFFRRNALRPKDFKCPYSDDCEINAVSRRFCQKCRLRKCFAVGMKKEWILNEEQLRRRKNSRLNNLANQQRQRHSHSHQHSHQMHSASVSSKSSVSSPVSILTSPDMQMHSPAGRHIPPILSPPGHHGGFPLLSPTDSSTSDSPPGRLGSLQCQPSPDAVCLLQYESNMMMQQRLAAATRAAAAATASTPQPAAGLPRPSPRVAVDHVRNQVIMSMDEYQNLIHLASTTSTLSPPGVGMPVSSAAPTSPEYKPNIFSPSALAQISNAGSGGVPFSLASSMVGSMENGGGLAGLKADMEEKLKNYVSSTVSDEMELDSSPSASLFAITRGRSLHDHMGNVGRPTKACFELNPEELRSLDEVREAFIGMNEPIDSGRQREAFMKADKTPADIMNIMDITMRRLVKMSKKLGAFNELSHEGKFNLLKGGMVELLTMRGVSRFDSMNKSWKSPVVPSQYQVSINMFDQLNMSNRESQKARFLDFVAAIAEEVRTNEVAMQLLLLVVLFSQRDSITSIGDQELIRKHNQDYSSLLSRYLGSLYGEDAHKFTGRIPYALGLLREIAANSVSLFMGTVRSEEAEPLPREFFKTE